MAKQDTTKKIKAIFPAARLKKIMQSNEDVGKMGVSVPYIVSKALETFLANIVQLTHEEVKSKKVNRISIEHITTALSRDSKYDFLSGVFTQKNK